MDPTALDITSVLTASTPWGQIAGLVGGLSTGILGFFDRKDERKRVLAELKLRAEIDAAKSAADMAKSREDNASAAYIKSVDSEISTAGSFKLVDAFRGLTRPGLTWYFTMLATYLTLALLKGWSISLIKTDPLFCFAFVSIWNMTDMCVTWWFGQRQVDKMTTTFGNATINAKVSGK